MLRLVWKDVVIGGWFLLAGAPLYVVQLAGMATVAPALLLVTLLFTAALAFGPIAIEEIQGTEGFWCSLPVGRRDVVLARYTSTLCGIAVGLGTSWVVASASASWIAVNMPHAPDRLGAGAYTALFAAFLVLAALFLPCYFRLGAGRGLTVFAVIVLALLVLASAVGSLAVHLAGGAEALEALRRQDPERLAAAKAWLDRWGVLLRSGMAGGAVFLFAASAVVSICSYAKRDI